MADGPRRKVINEQLLAALELLLEVATPEPPQFARDGGIEKLVAIAKGQPSIFADTRTSPAARSADGTTAAASETRSFMCGIVAGSSSDRCPAPARTGETKTNEPASVQEVGRSSSEAVDEQRASPSVVVGGRGATATSEPSCTTDGRAAESEGPGPPQEPISGKRDEMNEKGVKSENEVIRTTADEAATFRAKHVKEQKKKTAVVAKNYFSYGGARRVCLHEGRVYDASRSTSGKRLGRG